MKNPFAQLYFLALPFLALGAVCFQLWGMLFAFLVAAAVMLPREAAVWDATLIMTKILSGVMDSYKTRLPMLNYFSWDLGKDNPDVRAVKFNQEIIAHLALNPSATDHTPGEDLTTGAVNAKTLVVDVPMKIDRAKKVVLKLPAADAVALFANDAFKTAISNAGYALAKSVVSEGLGQILIDNFSHEIVEPAADVSKETLGDARVQLNAQTAGVPRYGICSPGFMSTLTNDNRIASGDYYGQRVEGDPYVTLRNIEGFAGITEYEEFPNTNHLEAFFFDPRAILFAVRQLNDPIDLALELGIPVPKLHLVRVDPDTGLTFTAYLWLDVKTHDIYVAVTVAFGFRAGKQDDEADDDSLMDKSGLRVVTQASA